MKLITNILSEYLKHNKRLVVPKLGAFIVKQSSGVIRFTELIRNDDGILRSLLMAYGVKELEASGMIDRFVFEIRHAINQGETYSIEGLGEFSPGDNNTINFQHKHEPKTYGGKIKPPVETLDLEKVRFLRTIGREEIRPTVSTADKQKPRRDAGKKQSEDASSIVKPDAYLRGLNYDKKKKKRRGEERTEVRKSTGTRSVITVIIFALLAVGIIWGVWQWRGGYGSHNANNDVVVSTTSMEVADTTSRESRDTTLIDSINISTEKDIETTTGNSYLNPQF